MPNHSQSAKADKELGPKQKQHRRHPDLTPAQESSAIAAVEIPPAPTAAEGGTQLQAQAANLSNGRLPLLQRQEMAGRIGQRQGNMHLQRVVTAARSSQTNGNGHRQSEAKSATRQPAPRAEAPALTDNKAWEDQSGFGDPLNNPIFDSPPPDDGQDTYSDRPEPGVLQTKLTVNEAGDVYEQEADQVADTVMRLPEPATIRRPAITPKVVGETSLQAIQRLAEDFQVTGLFVPPSDEVDRWEHFVFFDLNEADLEPSQSSRIDDFLATLTDPAQPVKLMGYASEEGEPGVNTSLVNDRIEEVAQELGTKGHTGAITRTSRVAASEGRIDYRPWRSVEMLEDQSASSVPDCSTQPQTTSFNQAQRNEFNLVKGEALRLVGETAEKLRNDPDDIRSLATQLFGPSPPFDRIAEGLDDIHAGLSTLTPDNSTLGTPCNDDCQGGTMAFVDSNSDHMTLCAAFYENQVPQQMRILIHESAHLNSWLDVPDRAYAWERLADLLGTTTPNQALNNADSYTMLVLEDHGFTNIPRTQAPTDDLSALPGGTPRENIEEALAYLQRWNTVTGQWIEYLYTKINDGITAGNWDGGGLDLMEDIEELFGVRVNSRRPTDRNRAVVAAIYDRFVTMGDALSDSIEVTVSTGNTEWAPGPGNQVAVAPSLWRRNARGRTRLLLRRLAMVSDVRPRYLSAYVELSDRFRQYAGEGP